ncbi:MAG TPA: hypothetical protein VFJ62_02190 [Usitatibacter sp.]|nr:hypothetical protein [Usitatibacter sp.]
MRTRRIAIAATLAVASLSSAAFAADGDAWYGTNRPEPTYSAPAFGPLPPSADSTRQSVTVYYEDPAPAPVIVEREYVQEPTYVVVPEERENPFFHVDPPAHPTVGRGLFNKRGENDFGQ